MFEYRRWIFVCDENLFNFDKSKSYSYRGNSFSDALLQFEKEIVSEHKEEVKIFTHFVSDNTFKYVLFIAKDCSVETPVTVEVYEE